MPSEAQQLTESFNRLAESFEKSQVSRSGGASNVRITQDVGRSPAWIAAILCAGTLGMTISGAFWVSGEFGRIDKQIVELREESKTMQSFLSAIYQVAPQLKPEEKK